LVDPVCIKQEIYKKYKKYKKGIYVCERGGGSLQLGPLVFKSAGSIYLGNNPFNHDRGRGINTQNTIFFFIIFHLLHQRLVATRLVSLSALFVFLLYSLGLFVPLIVPLNMVYVAIIYIDVSFIEVHRGMFH
jgi:hypothetical protein